MSELVYKKSEKELSEKLILEIDLYALEREWAEQASLRRFWGRQLIKAKKRLRVQETRVDWIKATISKEIRQYPKKFGFIKKDPTEAALKEAVLLDMRYQKSVRKLIRLEELVGQIDVDVKAIDHRKTALENEVSLWMGGYYATPRAKGELTLAQREELEQSARRAKSRSANEKIKNRKRE